MRRLPFLAAFAVLFPFALGIAFIRDVDGVIRDVRFTMPVCLLFIVYVAYHGSCGSAGRKTTKLRNPAGASECRR